MLGGGIEDVVIAGMTVILAAGLVPSIVHRQPPAMSTCVSHSLALAVITGAYFSLGRALNAVGQYDEALGALERGAATGVGIGRVLGGPVRALALLGGGDAEGARTAADDAIALSVRSGSPLIECQSHLAKATVLVRSDGASVRSEIEAELSEVERIIGEIGFRSMLPSVHELRAELAAVAGDPAGRERELGQALRLYGEMGATGHVQRVERELAS